MMHLLIYLFIYIPHLSKNELECVYINIGSIIVKKKPSSLKLTIKTMLQWYNFNGNYIKLHMQLDYMYN